jgi:hypothetical protein
VAPFLTNPFALREKRAIEPHRPGLAERPHAADPCGRDRLGEDSGLQRFFQFRLSALAKHGEGLNAMVPSLGRGYKIGIYVWDNHQNDSKRKTMSRIF